VLVLVGSAVGAVQIAKRCAGRVTLAAHPRFSPYIEGLVPDAPALLWPHDAVDGAGLRRHEIVAAVLVGAPESVRQDVHTRLERNAAGRKVQVVDAAAPGRIDRAALAKFWEACGRPAILLTGDPAWAATGATWLRSLGATVEVHGAATQLELL
jgi:hypothetical protein